ARWRRAGCVKIASTPTRMSFHGQPSGSNRCCTARRVGARMAGDGTAMDGDTAVLGTHRTSSGGPLSSIWWMLTAAPWYGGGPQRKKPEKTKKPAEPIVATLEKTR